MTTTTTDAEAVVRRSYQRAEGQVMDVRGFMDLFAADGMVNAGGQSYRGEHLGDLVVSLGKQAPDVHRELHRVHAMGNLVTVELSIQGTFTGPFETSAGVIQLTGAKLDTPGADVSYVEDGTRSRRGAGGTMLPAPASMLSTREGAGERLHLSAELVRRQSM